MRRRSKTLRARWPWLALAALGLLGCNWERDNPLDPRGTNPPSRDARARKDGAVKDGPPRKDRGPDGVVTPDTKTTAEDRSTADAYQPPGTWVRVTKGSFERGKIDTEQCSYGDTKHKVTLSNNFTLQATEVTQDQFQSLMGYNPSKFTDCGSSAGVKDCPVESVSWDQAADYCNQLSKKAGLTPCYTCSGEKTTTVSCFQSISFPKELIYRCPGYRLPTDAEWEYAYRAGKNTPLPNGDLDPNACYDCDPVDAVPLAAGWYECNADVTYAGCVDLACTGCPICAGTHPVGQKLANANGLYDMAGNVWEWANDWYGGLSTDTVTDPAGPGSSTGYHVIRGGAWDEDAYNLKASVREYKRSYTRAESVGFRCAKTLP